MDLQEEYLKENALILLKGIWYSELPPILDFDSFSSCILNAIEDIQNNRSIYYKTDNDGFVLVLNV